MMMMTMVMIMMHDDGDDSNGSGVACLGIVLDRSPGAWVIGSWSRGTFIGAFFGPTGGNGFIKTKTG